MKYQKPHLTLIYFFLGLTARTLLGISLNAHDARAQELPVTEIFVQGSTQPQPLQQLPASATIINPASSGLEQNTNFQDFIDTVPNLTWAGGSSRPRFFQIRGIGEFEQYTGAPNPSVATVVDDIDLSGLGIATSLFDVEQIEVLRGPQGIRFGSSALAGLVNVKSSDPTPFLSGRSQLSAGSDDLLEGGIAISGPLDFLSKDIQLRISASQHRSDGFRHNDFLLRDDSNERNELTSRIKLRYQPHSDFKLDFSSFFVDNDNGYDVFSIDNSLHTDSDKPGKDALKVKAGSIKISTKPDSNWEFSSITSRYLSNLNYSFDGDWGNDQFWGEFAPYDFFESSSRSRNVYAQELRAFSNPDTYRHGDTWQWLAGAYARRITELASIDQSSNEDIYNALDSQYRATTTALFSEFEVPLQTGTSFSLGARGEVRDAQYRDSNINSLKPRDSMWGGNTTLKQAINEELLGYALVSRGFKGGGVNPGASVPDQRKLYDPESEWNFELGAKGQWLRRSLRTNLALFHTLRRDSQLKLAIQDNPNDPLSFTYLTESQGRGRSTGAEFDAHYVYRNQFELFANTSLLSTDFSAVPVENSNLLGRDFSYAPDWIYAIGVKYNVGEHLFIKSDLTGKTSYFFDDSHNQRSRPYTLVNLAIGYRQNSWTWTLWGKNIFNKYYSTRGFFFGNEPPDFPEKLYLQRGDPAQVGTTISYAF